jgi:hypothetical protein
VDSALGPRARACSRRTTPTRPRRSTAPSASCRRRRPPRRLKVVRVHQGPVWWPLQGHDLVAQPVMTDPARCGGGPGSPVLETKQDYDAETAEQAGLAGDGLTPRDPVTRPVRPSVRPAVRVRGFSSCRAQGLHRACSPTCAALRSRALQRHKGYTYGLHGTPTTYTLEAAHRRRWRAARSCRAGAQRPGGDHHRPRWRFAEAGRRSAAAGQRLRPQPPTACQPRALLSGWGISWRLYDPMDPAALAAAMLRPGHAAWCGWRRPVSVTTAFPDLARPGQRLPPSRRRAGVRLGQHLGRRPGLQRLRRWRGHRRCRR